MIVGHQLPIILRNNMKKAFWNNYKGLLTLFIPLLFLTFGSQQNRAHFANDPEYIYLVNALAICQGKSVGHIDNPGTTVMQLEAAVIWITHLVSNSSAESLTDHVLDSPDLFVGNTRIVIMVLNTLMILLLGYITFRKTSLIGAALLLQLNVFFSENMLDHAWTKVSPEPMLVLASLAFLLVTIFHLHDPHPNRLKFVWLYALTIGFGLGTKATFLPLAIFPILILSGWKKKLLYVGSLPFSFILFTIPAIPEYENMYYWFVRLIMNTGKYGQGTAGFIDTATYFPNILKILLTNQVFTLILALSFILVVFIGIVKLYTRQPLQNSLWFKALIGLQASSIFGILLVAKQYNANHYLIPVLLLSSLLLIVSIKLTAVSLSYTKFGNPILAAFLILAIFLLVKRPPQIQYANEGYRITNLEMDTTLLFIKQHYPDHKIIHFYPFSLNKYSALNFGDVYTKRKILPFLKEKYPDAWFYDFYDNRLANWQAEIQASDITNFVGRKVLFTGMPKNDEEINILSDRGIPLNRIYQGRIMAIYELDTTKYFQKLREILTDTSIVISCGAERLSEDGEYIVGADGERFGGAWIRSREAARSGEYSFKIEPHTEYAIDYKLDNLHTDSEYEISIWRKSDDLWPLFVVSASDASIFYKAERDYLLKDDQGWQLIRIKFRPNENMTKDFKIFIWNRKKSTAFFDDLTIKRIRHI